jgi:hypothetical protein
VSYSALLRQTDALLCSKFERRLKCTSNFPKCPSSELQSSGVQDVAVHQLHANILHLQSQLMLAKATLLAKDVAIENLQLTNYQYRQLLSSSEKPKPETEALVGDTLHVTTIEGKGIRIDLPLILKRLKRALFAGDKK